MRNSVRQVRRRCVIGLAKGDESLQVEVDWFVGILSCSGGELAAGASRVLWRQDDWWRRDRIALFEAGGQIGADVHRDRVLARRELERVLSAIGERRRGRGARLLGKNVTLPLLTGSPR